MTDTEVGERWTCVGKRMNAKKVLLLWWIVDGAEAGDFTSVKNMPRATIGAIYDVTVIVDENGDRRIYTDGDKGPKFIRHLPWQDENVKTWRAEELAAEERHAILRARKKGADGDDPIQMLCAGMKGYYGSLRSHTQRRAALYAMIEEITS